MSTTDPATHRFGQTSTGNYEADLARMKEDLADMFKEKLDFVVGRSRLYRRPYVDAFDLIPYPAGWRVPDFVKFSGDDNGLLGSISANISLNLGKLVLASLCAFACFRYL